ncbi:MAG: Virginiamycin B lyase [Candidatus Eremiobacteraeota bacterium]|nr:Virginiamycin B lyase [Candidatus Eremiobacteraeota bacterium]MBV9646328.1 Virginiamycin B lyase [Candidatus Eremiobacteraeota bacterium]
MARSIVIAFLFAATASLTTAISVMAATNAAVRVVPAESVIITEFQDLPHGPPSGSNYFPMGITVGPDGALWVIDDIDQDSGQDVVARITTMGKRTATFQYGQQFSTPSFEDIVAGPDGALWITQDADERIVRVTLAGHFSTFSSPSCPISITAGPDRALWFTMSGCFTTAIGRITTSGAVTVFSNGITGNSVQDITAGPDGALWFTEPTNDRIGRITTQGAVTEYSMGIPSGSQPYSIAAGPDGALWFTEFAARRVARITTAGVVTRQSRQLSANPIDITAGPDSALWFTEMTSTAARIGRIATAGGTTEYADPIQGSGATAITAGPDGNLWFVDTSMNRVGRVKL